MPTYSYACTACEHHFDTVQKFTDPSLTDCPECSGRLRKLFSSVGIVFKGSGWYATDSRKGSSSNGSATSAEKNGADSSASSATTASGDAAGSGKDSGGTSSTPAASAATS